MLSHTPGVAAPHPSVVVTFHLAPLETVHDPVKNWVSGSFVTEGTYAQRFNRLFTFVFLDQSHDASDAKSIRGNGRRGSKPRNLFIIARSSLSRLVRSSGMFKNDCVSKIVSILWKDPKNMDLRRYFEYLGHLERAYDLAATSYGRQNSSGSRRTKHARDSFAYQGCSLLQTDNMLAKRHRRNKVPTRTTHSVIPSFYWDECEIDLITPKPPSRQWLCESADSNDWHSISSAMPLENYFEIFSSHTSDDSLAPQNTLGKHTASLANKNRNGHPLPSPAGTQWSNDVYGNTVGCTGGWGHTEVEQYPLEDTWISNLDPMLSGLGDYR